MLGGCLTAAPPQSATRPTLIHPQWKEDAFAEHLDFFYDAFEEGASPASQRVGAYVSAAMHGARLQPALEDRYRLGQAPGRPLGYVGYVGGKHPPVARQAVLVCADLSGARTTPEATALLEVARVYGIASQYSLMPERSVIFALWPREAGRQDPLAGLRAYLRRPTWRLDAVRAVFYVGLAPRLRSEAQALLGAHGIPLYRIALSAEADVGPAAQVDSSAQHPSAQKGTGQTRAALLRARRLAQRTHERLRAATLTGGKMMPALGDTLWVPRPSQEGRK